MEFHEIPGNIQITQSTYEKVKDNQDKYKYTFRSPGLIEIKGKGKMHKYLTIENKQLGVLISNS